MKYLFLLTTLISLNVFSQNSEPTKQETKDWIKSVIHTYGTGELKFEDGKIIYDDPYDPTGFHLINQAEIKNLGGVKIGNGTKGHKSVYMSCSKGKCVKVNMKIQGKSGGMDALNNNKFMIQLTNDLPEDLQGRLTKAFNHLIKLYGGKAIDNTF